jgi:signal transduction histidine kinase
MQIQDEERRRVARELHDGLGQDLAAAKMMLDALILHDANRAVEDGIVETAEIIDRTIQQVRSVSHLLHPPLLDEVGLLSALQWYLDGITKRSNIETSLDVNPPEFPRLTAELETAVFRIVQEAMTNVYRHSGARRAHVTLYCVDGHITVTVKDDGKGLQEPSVEMKPGGIGIGIGGMSQRAKELGGQFTLANANPGTLVTVMIPWTGAVSHQATAIA